MLRKRHIKLTASIFMFLMLATTPVFANTVFDIFNIVRRQMMRNEEMQKYVDIMRNGSDDIKDLANGKSIKNTKISSYTCADNSDDKKRVFDEKCWDWALYDRETLEKPYEQMEKIRTIIGTNEALGDQSIAYQYLRCLAGTKYKGIKSREVFDVKACKDIINWDYNPIILKDLADTEITQNLFAPKMKYFVVADEKGQVEIKNHPDEAESSDDAKKSQEEQKKIKLFVRKNLATNICNSQTVNETKRNQQAEIRNILAQSYAVAVASRRASEKFYAQSYPYMQSLLKDDYLKVDNLRKGIHLWIAADSAIIWQLGQLNAVQGLITELRILNNLGAIKTFNGKYIYLEGEIYHDANGDEKIDEKDLYFMCLDESNEINK